MNYHPIFNELIDFLVSLDPEKLIEFRFSENAQLRLGELLDKNEWPGLTKDEEAEMEKFMLAESIIGIAKARVLKNLL